MKDSINYFDIFHRAGVGIFLLREDMTLKYINIEALSIFGYSINEAEKIVLSKIISEKSYRKLEAIIFESREGKINLEKYQFEGINKNGYNIDLELIISMNELNNKNLYTIIIRDITDLKKKEKDLSFRAFFDQLTKIPNRTLLYDRAENTLNQATRSNESFAIIFIDLDEFKMINDSYGHKIGDKYLISVSKRLIDSARKSDTVSRVGGDEFIILMPKINNANDPINLAERIIHSNIKSINIDGNELFINTSIGISVFPEDGDTISKLIDKADKAMYKAKNLGKNQYSFNI